MRGEGGPKRHAASSSRSWWGTGRCAVRVIGSPHSQHSPAVSACVEQGMQHQGIGWRVGTVINVRLGIA
ncbi:hypothetical protein GCM10008023_05770 [Sphingomonas glacialis]|uniref:Uncharacterized protein n=1 Tax=Sphingomonas glacialis TaxID=658225 RepID=A0ABQ3L9D4_9SPHN|nr:hypothetical protein GCM10008023_05770 [Sphingomonas glacialis]